MANIYFTQFLRPNGRKKTVWIDRPQAIATVADFILSHGFRFECEVLAEGEISLTISDDLGDYAHVLSANDEAVPASVDSMILGFDVAVALKCREINRHL